MLLLSEVQLYIKHIIYEVIEENLVSRSNFLVQLDNADSRVLTLDLQFIVSCLSLLMDLGNYSLKV